MEYTDLGIFVKNTYNVHTTFKLVTFVYHVRKLLSMVSYYRKSRIKMVPTGTKKDMYYVIRLDPKSISKLYAEAAGKF